LHSCLSRNALRGLFLPMHVSLVRDVRARFQAYAH
jgi:hypothetical protein